MTRADYISIEKLKHPKTSHLIELKNGMDIPYNIWIFDSKLKELELFEILRSHQTFCYFWLCTGQYTVFMRNMCTKPRFCMQEKKFGKPFPEGCGGSGMKVWKRDGAVMAA
jgi:hypothetical protein